jgi:hypothetical protein
MSIPSTFSTPGTFSTLSTLSTLFLLFLALPVRATVLIPADLRDLSREAGTIARGVVVAVEPRWLDDRRAIETLVTLQAADYLKGRLGPTVQFRVPGGQLGRLRSVTVGAPIFAVGDHVVVFLTVRGPQVPDIVGLNQGLYRVARANNAWSVVPQPFAPGSPAGPIARGDTARRPMALAEFERRVRGLVSASR